MADADALRTGTVKDYQLVRCTTLASILDCSTRTVKRRAEAAGIPRRGLHLEKDPEGSETVRYLMLEWIQREEVSDQQIRAIRRMMV